MELKIQNFTEIETPEPVYGLSKKYLEMEYKIDDSLVPVELVLTEYAGDVEHDEYFSIDIKQGAKKFHGDEFSSAEEALKDAENRILELYDAYELNSSSVDEEWE